MNEKEQAKRDGELVAQRDRVKRGLLEVFGQPSEYDLAQVEKMLGELQRGTLTRELFIRRFCRMLSTAAGVAPGDLFKSTH